MLLTARVAALALAFAFASASSPAWAHDVYLLNDDHTDYGWNDTTAHVDLSMLDELDHALERIDATAANAPPEQARFNADGWWYLWLYQRDRSPEQFQKLVEAIASRHIGVPLNPFVELYGAMPTEAAIRAGYFPGRLERAFGLSFPMAQEVENHALPWGLASLWAGSGVRYAWKGVCGCNTFAPFADHTTDLFQWEGPDGKRLLMKWYEFSGNSRSFGGYAEARDNLSAEGILATLSRDQTRALPVSGLFGAGGDDLSWTTQGDAFVPLAQSWNQSHALDKVILTTGPDYFEAVEQSGAPLPDLRGGWGNDWDLWPSSLAERTAQTRRAVEQLRTAEALAAVVHAVAPDFWPPRRQDLEGAWTDYFKYFEHTWGASGSVGLSSVVDHKKQWAQSFAAAVATTDALAESAFARLFPAPEGELRVVVFNPLGHARTDVAHLVTASKGPFLVEDLETRAEVPVQTISGSQATSVEFLASDVPALGYRVYRLRPGTPAPRPNAATLSGTTFESDTYRLIVGARGQLLGLLHKPSGLEVAGSGLNDFGIGISSTPNIEAQGPVSTTLRLDLNGTPSRREHLTLYAGVDRVDVDDEVMAAPTDEASFRFEPEPILSRLRFEEVGAISSPGSLAQSGNYLPGARTDFVTLNHFFDFAAPDHHLVVSSADAYLARINQSGPTVFDLSDNRVRVLVAGNPGQSPITDQGTDGYFRARFALRVIPGPFTASVAMRTALEHQNPLRTILLEPNATGPLGANVGSFAGGLPDNVELFAFKPAEDPGQGIVARLWELDGIPTTAEVDLAPFRPAAASATSLIETDTGPLALNGSTVSVALAGYELRAFRFVPAGLGTGDGGVVSFDAGGGEAGDGGDPPIEDGSVEAGDSGIDTGDVVRPCGCQGAPAALVPLVVLGLLLVRRRAATG